MVTLHTGRIVDRATFKPATESWSFFLERSSLSTKDLAKEKRSSMEMEYVYVYIVDIETIAIFRHPLRALLRLVCIRVRGREIQ